MVPVPDTDPARSPSPGSMKNVNIELSSIAAQPAIGPGENGPTSSRYPTIASKPEGSGHQRLVLKTRGERVAGNLSSPLTFNNSHPAPRRSRQETSYQRAVNRNRRQHVDHILHKQMKVFQRQRRREKKKTGSSFGMMIMNRIKQLPDMYDTDDEQRSWGPGGLVSELYAEDDYGEQALRYRKVVERSIRRLGRAEGAKPVPTMAKKLPPERRKPVRNAAPPSRRSTAARKPATAPRSKPRSRPSRKQEEQLDDLDLELLGDKEDEPDDSIMDESEAEDVDLTEDDLRVRA